MRNGGGWTRVLIVLGAVCIVVAGVSGIPGPVIFGMATYLIPVVIIWIFLGDVHRIASSLESIERSLRNREVRARPSDTAP